MKGCALATSDPQLAITALDALERVGVSFAVLHREGATAHGLATSDVDIVADRPAVEALRAVTPSLVSEGLAPIMVWPYDLGGTASIFFSVEDASAGAQIDILYDPKARGQYGLRSESALAVARQGERWHRLSSPHETAYLVRKRAAKGERSELVRMATEVADVQEVLRAAGEIFTDESVEVVRKWSVDPNTTPLAAPRPRRLGRVLKRIRFPVGFAIVMEGEVEEGVEEISNRFSKFLPLVTLQPCPKPGPGRLSWYATDVGPVRWRAGLVIAVGKSIGSFLPFDLHASASSIRPSAVVDAMSARVTARLD